MLPLNLYVCFAPLLITLLRQIRAADRKTSILHIGGGSLGSLVVNNEDTFLC